MGLQSASGMASIRFRRLLAQADGDGEADFQVPQVLAQADGDGEADFHLGAGLDHGVGVEAAVGPHRELTLGPGVAHPAQRLPQEMSRSPGGIGPALPETGHQHLTGAGSHGQQRVIAPLAGVAPG